jgi:hypothetical protein
MSQSAKPFHAGLGSSRHLQYLHRRAYTSALLQYNVRVMALAPSNPVANQLLDSIIDMQAKLEQRRSHNQ